MRLVALDADSAAIVGLARPRMVPLRYPGHGLQMVAADIGKMAPISRIIMAASFQAADEMRRVQRLAYRMRQLQVTHTEFGGTAQQAWRDDPNWQPLREIIETLLVTWDWGEALVALQFVLKPAFDELLMTQFGRLARAAADDVLDRIFFSLNEDCAWHRACSGSLMLTAIRDTPESAPVIKGWIEKWAPRVSRAVSAFRPIFDEMLPGSVERCATVLSEIDQFGQTTLPHRAQPGKQYTRTDGDVTLSITDLGGCRLALWGVAGWEPEGAFHFGQHTPAVHSCFRWAIGSSEIRRCPPVR